MIRPLLAAAAMLAAALPAAAHDYAFDRDMDMAVGMTALTERLNAIDRNAAPAAIAAPPDPAAMKPAAPAAPAIFAPVPLPMPAKASPAQPLTFGKILDNR